MDAADRAALWGRARGYCERCGRPMREHDMAAHHRKRRSAGGTWAASNLLGCHHRCHNGATGSIHAQPLEARTYGWLVPAEFDPAIVPVLYQGAHWVLLADDWTTIPTVVSHEKEGV